MQNNGARLHCRYLSSRGEGEAVNQPIIEESAPLFHHILANPYLSFKPASRRHDEPRALRRRAGYRTALLTTHYDFGAGELFQWIATNTRIISIERRSLRSDRQRFVQTGNCAPGDAFGRRTPSAFVGRRCQTSQPSSSL